MKGEYGENKDHTTNMFAKLHETSQKFEQTLHPHQHFQLTRECQTSEEADSRSPGGATATPAKRELNGDGATIEVVRRPRGRPPGSKNKPKPPIVITRSTEPSMSPYVLEIPGGVDVVEAINRFCRRRNMGICVLTGSGAVANVSLRQPMTTPGATVTFHGRFDLLSLSATILPADISSMMLSPVGNEFNISLAGPQGQIVGGTVVGALIAAGTVLVIAASFNNPAYHRLPVEDVRNSGSGGGNERRSPSAVSCGGGDSGNLPAAAADSSCGMSIFGGANDVLWAPTARQPPHYG